MKVQCESMDKQQGINYTPEVKPEQISPIRPSFVASFTKGLEGASNGSNSGSEMGRTAFVSWLSMSLTSIVASQIAALSLSRLRPQKGVS